ncbi:MAG: DNA-3-methyladenine glycosylase [bacterium]
MSNRYKLVETLGLDRPAPEVARRLLGSELVRLCSGGEARVKIVETEAYREGDPASHSCSGATERSKVMFGPPGFWYIYLCYGVHWMINVVCGPEGSGEAVLIRAASPVSGRSFLEKNRSCSGVELTNGPGKLARALAINGNFNARPCLPETNFFLAPRPAVDIVYESPRVGISDGREKFWRFYTESDYVSEAQQNVDGRCRD